MILIISFVDNAHVDRVTRHLTRPFEVVDQAWFPSSLGLSIHADAQKFDYHFKLPDGRSLDLEQVRSVWYRRLRPLTLDDALIDNVSRTFAWSESNEALQGVFYSLPCFWMNHPTKDEVAQRKVRQLQVAREVGLSIPETCITNDPATARAFIEAHEPGDVIRKAFRNIPEAPRETARVQPEDLARIDTVAYAPVTFQKFVPADLDLRTTVVDGELFTAAIRSTQDYQVDYRSGLGSAEMTPYRLPDQVADSLNALMDKLDLKFGAVDFRVTPDGEHVFLEVNPAGEYLFVADRIDLPIPQAIAAALERHCG
jgi:glutathione synthase/RimK-type ligase-like ATP-grasp enzyme